uniref:Uncharacterized protein AlNc14C41G3513 n=1 Tax=Albugo laibachii Nc14 TaxID=890382 RepID=F0W9Q9_9STRA|nr:conserved hypothetical protein [Albugo laibachii Nc14]|eukprot:CCA17877.1 conserved hypothetical protein [Albugo laibachii Nc14]
MSIPQPKCRSEQQIMNDLTKLITLKEFTSKKTTDVLRELAVCYASPNLTNSLPPSVLRDLRTLLKSLKDKKEDIRLAKFVYSFLTRAMSQFESLTLQNVPSETLEGTQSQLRLFLQDVENSEIAASSVWRKHTAIKMYAQLCRIFHQSHNFLNYAKSILSTSPVWSSTSSVAPPSSDSKRKIGVHSFLPSTLSGKKDLTAHLSVLNATFHGIRHFLKCEDQRLFLDKLFEAFFCLPKTCASRHASAIIYNLFQSGGEYAENVIRALEVHILVSKPVSLYLGDVMASIYMIHVCARISRLDGNSKIAIPPLVSNCVREWILDLVVGYLSVNAAQDPLPRAVLAVTLEEMVLELPAEATYLHVRGTLTIFEVVSAAILKLLRDPSTHSNSVGLHRVYRVIETTAKSLDSVTLKSSVDANVLCKLTEKMMESVCHPSEFVAIQCFRGLVWLLPRPNVNKSPWKLLMSRILELSEKQIPSEMRVSLANALLDRAVTFPKAHDRECDIDLLRICLAVVLFWFKSHPCVWHGDILVSIWRASSCLPCMRDAHFTSIQLVLGFYQSKDSEHSECIAITHSQTLWYLYEASACVVEHPVWAQSLVLQLTRHLLLASSPLRRASTHVLGQICLKARENLPQNQDLIHQITDLMKFQSAFDEKTFKFASFNTNKLI